MLLAVGWQRTAAAPVDGWEKEWPKLVRGSSGTSRRAERGSTKRARKSPSMRVGSWKQPPKASDDLQKADDFSSCPMTVPYPGRCARTWYVGIQGGR